jgi:hypothetical protein
LGDGLQASSGHQRFRQAPVCTKFCGAGDPPLPRWSRGCPEYLHPTKNDPNSSARNGFQEFFKNKIGLRKDAKKEKEEKCADESNNSVMVLATCVHKDLLSSS